MKKLAAMLVDRLDGRGVDYGDVRVIRLMTESLTVRDGTPESVEAAESYGVGVRVFVDGRWGFAASDDLSTDRLDRVVEQAILTAHAAAFVGGPPERFDPPPAVTADWVSPCEIDPRRITLEEKLAMLAGCARTMLGEPGVRKACATMDSWEERKVFASTTGSVIAQTTISCGAGIAAHAIGTRDVQVRSYPNSFRGNFASAGYEFIESLALPENAARVASEAVQLLRAPLCPSRDAADLVIGSSQLALQIHESIGHAIEFDRILGHEASFAGTSFVAPDDVGTLRYGSPLVNVVADSTTPMGLGTFAYDDEGTPAMRDPVISGGRLVGVLTSAGTAHLLGRRSNATMRADGWGSFPIIRMTNVNLEPGTGTLDELIADTRDGFLLDTNKSWSIDDKRINFQFATEVAREIRNGKLGRLYRNPVYSGVTTRFWSECDAVCGPSEWRLWGITNCGKGEPMQVARVGHGCAPARFRRQKLWGA